MFHMVDSFLRKNKDRFYHNGHLDNGIASGAASKGETPFPKICLAIGQRVTYGRTACMTDLILETTRLRIFSEFSNHQQEVI